MPLVVLAAMMAFLAVVAGSLLLSALGLVKGEQEVINTLE